MLKGQTLEIAFRDPVVERLARKKSLWKSVSAPPGLWNDFLIPPGYIAF